MDDGAARRRASPDHARSRYQMGNSSRTVVQRGRSERKRPAFSADHFPRAARESGKICLSVEANLGISP